jgi:predicted enzyme related to lactoylglutathione lyase
MATGDICHIEIPTTDLEASRRFYSEVFGWTVEDAPGMTGYALFRTPSGLGGGLNAAPGADAPTRSGPILHIEVQSIDSALADVGRHGGTTLVPKTKISDEFGSFALFIDNVGNRLGLWSAP